MIGLPPTLPSRKRRLAGFVQGIFIIIAVQLKSTAAFGGEALTEAVTSKSPEETQPDQPLIFDSDFLDIGGNGEEKHVDLSYFAYRGGLQPGRYAVQVTVNGKIVDNSRMVEFRSWPDRPGKLYACVSTQQMAEWWGIIASRKGKTATKEHRVPFPVTGDEKSSQTGSDHTENSAPSTTDAGEDITAREITLNAARDSGDNDIASCPVGGVVAAVPYAKEVFDFNNRSLSLTVPQASLGPASRMRTDPRLWDEGIPAVLMNYNYSGNQQNSDGDKRGSHFLGLNGQMNVLGWRVRNDLTWHKSQGQSAEWNSSQLYAQHDYSSLGGGQLTVGHTTSSGSGVDSVPFVGMKIDSDQGMLDPLFTTYSPAITGIANSPATVTVRQYGKVIYQQNVPQGPFSLTDFNRSGNGNVDVEIREADGSTRYFTMAQANGGSLLRQGGLTYSASVGHASNATGYADNKFVQTDIAYGVRANTTLNGSTLISKDYQALSVGTAIYADAWGSVSYTLQTSRADLSAISPQEGTKNGVSHEVSWSRSFGDTSVSLNVSHSQTPNFYSYTELVSMRPEGIKNRASGSRDSYSLSLSQSLGIWGSVSLSGSRFTSWGNNEVQNNISFNYNTTVKNVGIGIALGYSTYNGSNVNKNSDNSDLPAFYEQNKTDKTIAVNISLPLEQWLNVGGMSGTYSYSKYNGSINQQAGINGSALGGSLSYSASQGMGDNKTGNTSVGYSGRYGAVNSGYSYGNGNNSVSYGFNGGLAIHPHGVTLGKQVALNSGNALVQIPDTGGINVGNAVTDWRGYALISGLTPYDSNQINVDMTNLPGNVELDMSSKNIVPSRGALVSVQFRSNKGYRLFIDLIQPDAVVPFGSTVALIQDDENALPVTGIVGDAGQVYMSGMPEKGKIIASWGNGASEQCTATYILPLKADAERLHTITANCQ
ncbi:fimbria/pilus outer membrane usher protein [Enterobacteriaceae bacterium LUAb1]